MGPPPLDLWRMMRQREPRSNSVGPEALGQSACGDLEVRRRGSDGHVQPNLRTLAVDIDSVEWNVECDCVMRSYL